MATASFHARLARIERAQAQSEQAMVTSFRTPGVSGVKATRAAKRHRRRHPMMEHLMSILFGLVLGCLAAVALLGLSLENSPWGPGTAWHDIAYYPAMAGLGLAPLLIILSLFKASSRPGFALFSLAYLSGIIVPLFI